MAGTLAPPHGTGVSAPVVRTLAWRYFENDRLSDAVTYARRAIELRGDEARSHLVLGVALARQQRNAEASQALLEATRLDPGSADAWMNLSRLQLERGDLAGSARSRRLAEEATARANAR